MTDGQNDEPAEVPAEEPAEGTGDATGGGEPTRDGTPASPTEATENADQTNLNEAVKSAEIVKTNAETVQSATTYDAAKAAYDNGVTCLANAKAALAKVPADSTAKLSDDKTREQVAGEVSGAEAALKASETNLTELLTAAEATWLYDAYTEAGLAKGFATAVTDNLEKQKAAHPNKPTECNPAEKSSDLANAKTSANNAREALDKVRSSTTAEATIDDSTTKKYAEVKAAVEAAEKAVKDAQLAVDEMYLQQAVDYIAAADEATNAVYDIIKNTDTNDEAARESAKEQCNAKISEATENYNKAEAAYAAASDAGKAQLTTYKDLPKSLSNTESLIQYSKNQVTIKLASDAEKIDAANDLSQQAEDLYKQIDDENAKGADADTDQIYEWWYDAKDKNEEAKEILNSVSDKTTPGYSDAKDKVDANDKKKQTTYDDIPFATDGTKSYKYDEVTAKIIKFSSSDAQEYLDILKKSSAGKNVDFSRGVIFDVRLVAKDSGKTVTPIGNQRFNVELNLNEFTGEELKNAKVFHIDEKNGNKVELVGSVSQHSATIEKSASKKCWISVWCGSFSPYGVGDIASAAAVTSSAPSTGQKNPNTGDFSALPIVLICVVALGGIGGVLAYRKKKAAEEEEE